MLVRMIRNMLSFGHVWLCSVCKSESGQRNTIVQWIKHEIEKLLVPNDYLLLCHVAVFVIFLCVSSIKFPLSRQRTSVLCVVFVTQQRKRNTGERHKINAIFRKYFENRQPFVSSSEWYFSSGWIDLHLIQLQYTAVVDKHLKILQRKVCRITLATVLCQLRIIKNIMITTNKKYQT